MQDCWYIYRYPTCWYTTASCAQGHNLVQPPRSPSQFYCDCGTTILITLIIRITTMPPTLPNAYPTILVVFMFTFITIALKTLRCKFLAKITLHFLPWYHLADQFWYRSTDVYFFKFNYPIALSYLISPNNPHAGLSHRRQFYAAEVHKLRSITLINLRTLIVVMILIS